jgi:hypothetical protein
MTSPHTKSSSAPHHAPGWLSPLVPLEEIIPGGFSVFQNLFGQAASKILTFVKRYGCRSTVGMPKELVTAFLSRLPETRALQELDHQR